MSIYLSGSTFAEQHVTPADDGAAFASALSDGILTGCAITSVGSTLKIEAGKILACGRVARIAAAQNIPVTGATSGYARLLLTVDLSKTSTSTTFEQVALDIETANAVGSFPALVQDDINNGGTKYQIVVCVMSLSAAGISAILWTCGKAHGKGAGISVTLPANGWSNNEQTVSAGGVTANSNVIATYAPASREEYQGAGIYLSAQGEGTLTFSCDSAPTEAVTANVILL